MYFVLARRQTLYHIYIVLLRAEQKVTVTNRRTLQKERHHRPPYREPGIRGQCTSGRVLQTTTLQYSQKCQVLKTHDMTFSLFDVFAVDKVEETLLYMNFDAQAIASRCQRRFYRSKTYKHALVRDDVINIFGPFIFSLLVQTQTLKKMCIIAFRC